MYLHSRVAWCGLVPLHTHPFLYTLTLHAAGYFMRKTDGSDKGKTKL